MQNSARWNMTPAIKHGTIWLANLNPQKGTEPGKTRPVLILQDQALLDAGHPSTIIIPLTTISSKMPNRSVSGSKPVKN